VLVDSEFESTPQVEGFIDKLKQQRISNQDSPQLKTLETRYSVEIAL
jgi:hypothetical protein